MSASLREYSPSMGAGRECKSDRRNAIATAARDLIVEKGFEGLRTRDIAMRVGINIATLHYHVPTKEALIDLMAESIRADFIAQGQRHSREGLDGLACLKRELADFRETLVESPDLIVVFCQLLDRARRNSGEANVITPMYEFWFGQIETIVSAGRADGSMRPDVDPQGAAHMVTGALGDFWRHHARNLTAYDSLAEEIVRAVRAQNFQHKDALE